MEKSSSPCARVICRRSRRNSGTTGNGSSRIASPRSRNSSSISNSRMRSAPACLLSGDKLALAVTPHFFNLIERDNPDCPIRRQVIPRIEETWASPYDMADPCGEDSHMPVPGLVHRYPDRVLFLVTDRCASYCRYCTRSPCRQRRRRTGAAHRIRGRLPISRRTYRSARRALIRRRRAPLQRLRSWRKFSAGCARSRTSSFSASAPACRFSFRNGSRPSFARCCRNIIRSG